MFNDVLKIIFRVYRKHKKQVENKQYNDSDKISSGINYI